MTPPAPARDTLGGRAYNDLRNLARRHQRDPAEYITLYALEGFLARLAASEFAADFVLKGGVLMAAFAPRRPTRDVDFAARSFTNDTAEVEQRIRQIVSEAVPDGLEFESTSVRGDPIWPAPTEAALPLLLGGTLQLAGYPDHMVLAEKIVTAIDIVADHRNIDAEPLEPLLGAMPDLVQRKWENWRKRQRLEDAAPLYFRELLNACFTFADPALNSEADHLHWDPLAQSWKTYPT